MAASTDELMADEGDLWAFVSDTPGVKNYYDVPPGSAMSITGHFIQVPKDIATGLNPDGSELKSADKGSPPPPNNISNWQTDLRSVAPLGIDGPQWVLEYWSDLNNVFQFVRVEDIAYDKRPGMGNVVYIADSGRGRTDAQSLDTPTSGRRTAGSGRWCSTRRTRRRSTRSRCSPRVTTTPSRRSTRSTSPTTSRRRRNSVLVTEDPGSSQQFPPDDRSPNATTARLWRIPIANPSRPPRLSRR